MKCSFPLILYPYLILTQKKLIFIVKLWLSVDRGKGGDQGGITITFSLKKRKCYRVKVY